MPQQDSLADDRASSVSGDDLLFSSPVASEPEESAKGSSNSDKTPVARSVSFNDEVSTITYSRHDDLPLRCVDAQKFATLALLLLVLVDVRWNSQPAFDRPIVEVAKGLGYWLACQYLYNNHATMFIRITVLWVVLLFLSGVIPIREVHSGHRRLTLITSTVIAASLMGAGLGFITILRYLPVIGAREKRQFNKKLHRA